MDKKRIKLRNKYYTIEECEIFSKRYYQILTTNKEKEKQNANNN